MVTLGLNFPVLTSAPPSLLGSHVPLATCPDPHTHSHPGLWPLLPPGPPCCHRWSPWVPALFPTPSSHPATAALTDKESGPHSPPPTQRCRSVREGAQGPLKEAGRVLGNEGHSCGPKRQRAEARECQGAEPSCCASVSLPDTQKVHKTSTPCVTSLQGTYTLRA